MSKAESVPLENTPSKMPDDRHEAEVSLGLRGTYYLWDTFESTKEGCEDTGEKLTDWCLAYNQDSDLVFLKTKGYYAAYFIVNSAPGGSHFLFNGISVKSRDCDDRFMVMERAGVMGLGCSRDDMVEFAWLWGGYELSGEAKEYYLTLIAAAMNEEGLEPLDTST